MSELVPEAGAPPCDFRISPNISIGRRGSAIVLALAAIPAAVIATVFTLRGHWPVAVFAAVAVAALGLGFACARRSLRRVERIFLSEDHVVIERRSLSGHQGELRIPLLGLHLERAFDPDYGLRALVLRHRDRRTEIARDLSPAERVRFEAAFVEAVHAAGHSIHMTTVASHAEFAREVPQ